MMNIFAHFAIQARIKITRPPCPVLGLCSDCIGENVLYFISNNESELTAVVSITLEIIFFIFHVCRSHGIRKSLCLHIKLTIILFCYSSGLNLLGLCHNQSKSILT